MKITIELDTNDPVDADVARHFLAESRPPTPEIADPAESKSDPEDVAKANAKAMKAAEAKAKREAKKEADAQAKREAEAAKGPTLPEVRAVLGQVVQNFGAARAGAVLAEFGVKKITEVPAERYAELQTSAQYVLDNETADG